MYVNVKVAKHICCTTEQVRGMGLFLGWRHKLLCMHVYKDLIRCKSVCDVNPGIDPYPLLAQLCNRLWPDFETFTACKKSRFGLKWGKKAQCISNRCKDLFERKKYFGVRCTLKMKICLKLIIPQMWFLQLSTCNLQIFRRPGVTYFECIVSYLSKNFFLFH